jgi:predicted metal-dependent phosphoesterase TrpH
MELKADLHLHTREGERFVEHDARGLIDRAAALGFHVLSLTDHDRLTFDASLEAYARARGILLIPGVEATIEGAHVLVYNLDVPPARLRTFADLRRLRGPDWLVAAPHPFFPAPFALRHRLVREIDLFDAVELSHFYTPWIDFNRPAVRLAREIGLPLIGTSDSHLVRQLGTTYSLIDAEPTAAAVLTAIRKGQIRVVSRPLTLRESATIAASMVIGDYRERVMSRFRRKESTHAR